MNRIHNEPSEVTAEEGEVIVEGPHGTNYSMTPSAARETADRMIIGARDAFQQSRRPILNPATKKAL